MNRKTLIVVGVAAIIGTGCATKWHNQHLQDPSAESAQFKVDDAYCELVAINAAPMPEIRTYQIGQTAYDVSGTINTHNWQTQSNSTSQFYGTLTPNGGSGFAGGVASGMSSGVALGAAIAAKRQQSKIHDGCMVRLGWREGKSDQTKAIEYQKSAVEN